MARWRLLRHTQHMLALRFAGYQPARSVHTRALHALRDGVARRANGAFAMTVTDSIVATGRKAADLLTKVASGELDGCYFASSYLAARVPADVHRCRRPGARGGGTDSGGTGEPAHQPGELQPADVSQACQPERAF